MQPLLSQRILRELSITPILLQSPSDTLPQILEMLQPLHQTAEQKTNIF